MAAELATTLPRCLPESLSSRINVSLIPGLCMSLPQTPLSSRHHLRRLSNPAGTQSQRSRMTL